MNGDDWENEREDVDMIYESSDDERERDGVHNVYLDNDSKEESYRFDLMRKLEDLIQDAADWHEFAGGEDKEDAKYTLETLSDLDDYLGETPEETDDEVADSEFSG